ncbi:hypothetical protein WMY93_010590 [Mugilogobius chulae]|uniref:Uncharacterized protein n=1 Tax=Mugilogobius chulae TaxID=88201 RepID=A0AAW0PDG9_9GOBI
MGGLGQQRALQILHLSFNKISTLENRDLDHLNQLRELHLQHNLISSLHPQIFEKLDRLELLDLSFNLLTRLHPVTYINLNHIGTDVGLRGNSWICDCGMRFLQRQMDYGINKDLGTWSIECGSPLTLSGMNLQELDEEDLECQDSDVLRDVTVHRGSEMLLTCSEPDATWWTPSDVNKNVSFGSSSSSSDLSDGEPTEYTVNPGSEDEGGSFDKTASTKSSSSSSDMTVKMKESNNEYHQLPSLCKHQSLTPSLVVKKPKFDTSSSESEDEQEMKMVTKENLQQIAPPINKQPNCTKNHHGHESSGDEEEFKINHPAIAPPTVESQWPAIDLVRIPKVKQRLDIKESGKVKVPSSLPSTTANMQQQDISSSSESEVEEVKLIQSRVPSTKQRPTSSSESDNEAAQKVGVTGSQVEPQTQWPVIELRGATQIKRRLDFKVPSQTPSLAVPSSPSHILHNPSSSSSDDDEKVTQNVSTRLPTQTSPYIPYISRRLDIKAPSSKPVLEDPESSSSSDEEKDKSKIPSGSVISQDTKHFIKVSPISTISRSPSKTSPSIELEKYTIIADDPSDKASTGSTSPVVTPELQSKWANMNLGRSRFRKRLDITRSSDPPSLPSTPPPSSPKQDKIDSGMMKATEQVLIAPTREINVDNSSNSESDEDAVGVPDLSKGIPRIKRRLNIKAPTPPPSSSSSDDDKVYAHRFSDVTDQRSIEYKRTIMKSTSSSFSANRDIYREPLYVESNLQTPKKLSLDSIKRKLLPSKQRELPPNMRWSSVGSHLSEHPLPIPKRHPDGNTSPPPMSSPPPKLKDSSSDSCSSEDERKELKSTVIVTQKTYNPRSVTFNTSPTIIDATTFDNRTERRGLSALKAMSSDRKNWDSETFTESIPVSVDYAQEHLTVYRRSLDIKTKISQPQSYSTVSPTLDERRRAGMLYGIPSYKTHSIKSTELPLDLPPPVPSTPLPEESVDFTWRSPQSSLSRGSLSYVQTKTTEEESVDDPFYNNPNISAV